MPSSKLRQQIARILIFAILLSTFPMNALAAEIGEDPGTQESIPETTETVVVEAIEDATQPVGTESTSEDEAPETEPTIILETEPTVSLETEEIDKLSQLQADLDALLLKYLPATVMTQEAVMDVVVEMLWDDMQQAREELDALAAAYAPLSEEEIAELEDSYEGATTVVYFYEALVFATTPSIYAATGSHNPIAGSTDVRVDVSGASDNNMENGTIKVTATGSAPFLGIIGGSTKTATIKVYNDTQNTATISFDWVATDVNALVIDGETKTAGSGGFSKLMKAGESITITITTAKNNTTNKLVMSNFNLVAAAATADVTFEYDSSLGSITVGGNEVSSGDTVTGINPAAGSSVIATPNSGNFFLGWVNTETNKVELSDASGTLKPSDDMIVRAVFVPAASNAWFLAGGDHLFDDLNDAVGHAKTAPNKTVVLMNSGTLPADDYTIPEGVTLLIPRDDDNTVYTTKPAIEGNQTYIKPTVYRCLTMASGAKITVNGAISIAGMQQTSQTYGYNGTINGPTGYIKMNSGSSITVNSGAFLYAWGYIYGSGDVTIKSGGTVYESFQVRDYRGGDATNSIYSKRNTWRLFPMMQYYVQNVEVPMNLEAGAVEKCVFSVYVTLAGIQSAEISFIASDGLFNLTDGYIIKDYDEETDRLVITTYGDFTMQSYSFSLKMQTAGSFTFNSEEYVFPINHNITVDAKNGSNITISQDLGLLPGATVLIQEGATCTLTGGAKIYLYDGENWGNYCGQKINTSYANTTNTTLKPLTYVAHTPQHNRWTDDLTKLEDASIMVDGTLDATKGFLYTSENGANIYSTGTGEIIFGDVVPSGTTYQVTQDEKKVAEVTINFTSAQLKHGDGTYLSTADANNTTYRYSAQCGKWYAGEHTAVSSALITEPSSTELGSAAFTCSCGQSYEAPVHVKLQAIEASADAEVILKQKFFVPKELVDDGAYAKVTKITKYDEKDHTEKLVQSQLSELTPDGSGRYVLSMGVASGEMTCPVTVQFFDKDNKELTVLDYVGNVIGTEVSRSVVDYARLALERGNDRQKALMTALVTYGGYAQLHFKVDAANPAYDILSEFGKTKLDITNVSINKAMTSSGAEIGIEMTGMQSVSLDSKINLQPHFTLTGSFPITDYSAELTYPVNGTTGKKTLVWIDNTTKYSLNIENIPAAYLDNEYIIDITRNGETYKITTSVLAYLTNLLNGGSSDSQKNLAKAMYLYNDAASTYFNK